MASDYAGTALLAAISLVLLAGGLLHRPAVAAERADVAAAAAATHDYVVSQKPAYDSRLGGMDVLRIEDDLYRSCVPGPDPDRWLCLFVNTTQRPAGVTADRDATPNSAVPRPRRISLSRAKRPDPLDKCAMDFACG